MAACTAFAIGFNIRPTHLAYASAGAFLSEFIFSVLFAKGVGEVRATFIAAIAAGLYSEIMARKLRAPASMYLIVSIIPLVPGGMLYRTMSAFVSEDIGGGIELAVATIGVAGAAAMGIFAVSSAFRFYSAVKRTRLEGKK